MPSFEELFLKSKGKPVVFNNKTIQMVDRLPMQDGQKLEITFEGANGDWRQGVCLTTDGGFIVNNQTINKSIILWYDTAPKTVQIKIATKRGELQIKNVWDTGDGVVHSWHNGAAMIVEDIVNGRRYLCNDGVADDDFNNLIFRLNLTD
jgi:hypothetical protein